MTGNQLLREEIGILRLMDGKYRQAIGEERDRMLAMMEEERRQSQ